MALEKIRLKHGSPEWLAFRRTGIGASEAAAAIGQSKFKTNIELWEEKVGLRQPKDLSDNPRVQYGAEAEKYLIGLFRLQYADRYKVKVDKRTVYLRDGFQFASLDGELIDLMTREAGVWEGKTVLADNSLVWEEWKDQMPQDYYAQILHQLLVTERKFSVINPEFRWLDMETNEIRTSVRRMTVRVTDKNIASDMKYLDEAEHEFWNYVTMRERPPLILPQF